jgi:hypothetical protein
VILHVVPSTPSTRLDALEEARRLKVAEARMGFLLREVAELRTIAEGLMRRTQAAKAPPQLTVVQGGDKSS